MGQIIVLDENMVNMIAAGEVIERPANVVKELIENSIDAGATKIGVCVEDGGRKSISVTDNGRGMDAEDLHCAFESHSTSKIKTSADLRGISSLGFRGEALASIASIAQVRALSRTADSAEGNCMEIDCGRRGDVSPCSANVGTTIEVRDIFYKLPARRKFLKTANTEMGHISEHFTRIALANTDIDMSLTANGREIHRLTGGHSLRQRIAELLSSEFVENLIEVESKEKGLGIFGLLGKPSISRTNSKFQYVFVNGRFIRDRFVSHAVKEAYRAHLEPNRFPVVFLFIEIPCEEIDVNVHPTKIEVRFYNANLVHSQILGCLREKLLGANFEARAKLPPTDSRKQSINEAMNEFFKKHGPVRSQAQLGFAGVKEHYQTRTADISGSTMRQVDSVGAAPYLPGDRRFLQIHDSYIAVQTEEGFVIIDQHALHERIIYEALRKRTRESKLESQRLLIPESFEVTGSQVDVITTYTELIEKFGIELVPFGPQTMAVQAFPTLLTKAGAVDFVKDLIDLLGREGGNCDAEMLLDAVFKMAACKAAIKAGQKLSASEIAQLLADREAVELPERCPHGRPTTIRFLLSELEKEFKRT